MYFICMGEVEVLPHIGEDPVATLKEGDMFGEVDAILHHVTYTKVAC